ncbi:MAG: hypothetical protein RMX96_16585 [Nostoc sp. ChiSLP02]|nr:hypothetical protein [Nostoc sp. DedSLP05]MDZ8100559.1 hypothetical protein [Nostoc sp. DedSLP01]MDZ8186453.1 hypothetical protein [Nostoc sp. ChiSLP02]
MVKKMIPLNRENMQPGRYNLIIRRLNLKENPTQNDYVQSFALLPDFVIKANGILISEQKERDLAVLISSHRDAFKAIHKWIVHFDNTTNNSSSGDPAELSSSWEFDYKPHAQQSWALLNLCKEILKHDQFEWKASIEYLSAAELWFSCEFERLENTFKRTGILGPTSWTGKHSECDVMSRQIRENYNSLPSRRFAEARKFQENQIQSWDSTEEAIRVHAEKIAQQDREFNSIYCKYNKIRLQTLRSIRNNPNLQFAALKKNGFLSMGGIGKRGEGQKPSKHQKGFCKEK